MTNPTSTICGHCKGPITTDYIRLGASVDCPHCHQRTVPEVPMGGTIPMSGYSLTYRDFRRLLKDPTDRNAVAPHLRAWFAFEIRAEADDVFVFTPDHIAVDPLWLHLRIQADPPKQEALYQTAMSQWR